MANDNWQGRSHGEIVSLLSELKSDAAHEESLRWDNTSTAVADSIDTAMGARQKLLDDKIWSGDAADTAYTSVDSFYKEAANPQTGLAAEAGKISQAALQDGETLIAASRVAQNYPEPGPGAPTDRKKEELAAIRAEAQRMYTDPLTAVNRPEITDGTGQQQLGQIPQGGGNSSGGNSGGGSGGGTQTPPSTDGLANKDTKPQLAGGDGQQQAGGQGQGQGGGQGSGSGGGQGSGSGGGQGSGGAGSGLGSGSGGSGLPLGSTTAAGFSPSSTGTGGGTGTGVSGPGGLSALRGGAGLPGGAAGGAGAGGVNPAGVGAAGVRGMGPMGMMGGGGGHGRGGKGEDDDDHAIPEFLKNLDNGQELFGDERKFVPGGVIGDFQAMDEVEKQAREAEKRRFKSMGWDVKFE